MNAFLRKVATVCVAFLLCASMGTIAFANDLPIYSEWAKAEVSAAENEGLLPFEMYDDCRRALHRDWATAFLVKFVEIATNASIEGSDVQVFDDVPIGHTMFEDINKAYRFVTAFEPTCRVYINLGSFIVGPVLMCLVIGAIILYYTKVKRQAIYTI